jgi:hypothetical protein
MFKVIRAAVQWLRLVVAVVGLAALAATALALQVVLAALATMFRHLLVVLLFSKRAVVAVEVR